MRCWVCVKTIRTAHKIVWLSVCIFSDVTETPMTADFSPRRSFGVQLETVPRGHIMVYVAMIIGPM